jgi:predicted RNase H-like nuclease
MVFPLPNDNATVVGIDGCPAGWICFEVGLQTRRTTVKIVERLADLILRTPRPLLVAIDIPIGLPTGGPRPCDIAARKLLRPPRSSSVFPAPVRSTFAANTYSEACALSFRAQGKKLSRQAFEIISKIREVDDLMTPEVQRWVFEIHSELSFWALNGRQPLKHRKGDREGKEERLSLLIGQYLNLAMHLGEIRRSKAEQHDLLDAAVAAWTAERVATGIVPRQFDNRGLRMEIVF